MWVCVCVAMRYLLTQLGVKNINTMMVMAFAALPFVRLDMVLVKMVTEN